ncbi:MAG: CBS domain-containing protein [Geovibrio sp.]|nr:CBS domain-containing protein [Geovibrio sp.]
MDGQKMLKGILTDGDLRRGMEKHRDMVFAMKVEEVCTKTPKTIPDDALAAKALSVMETYSITSLVTVDSQGRPSGIIHLHDLLRAGLA